MVQMLIYEKNVEKSIFKGCENFASLL